MVSRNTLRSRLLALATGAGLVAGVLGTTAVQAEQYQFGDIEVFFDTTVSVGASMRTASRMNEFLAEGNGGNQETRGILNATVCDTADFAASSGATCNTISTAPFFIGFAAAYGADLTPGTPDDGLVGVAVRDTNDADNFSGSVNGDDGRLNYDRGDLIGAASKVTHDLEINWRNFTVFTRASYFYDAVLNDPGATDRSPLGNDVRNDIGHGFEVLDAFISTDFEIPGANIPATFRQGYQVINWGEATFFLNGISTFNPIDVTAFRRPGAELREAFVPVHASFIQMALPYELSLEAFYQWEWRGFELDPAGSPFSGADIIRPYDGVPGLGDSFISGSPYAGTYRRNCDTYSLYADPAGPLFASLGTAPLGVLNQIGLGLGAFAVPDPTLSPGNCQGTEIDMRYFIPLGEVEETLVRNGDLNIVHRMADLEPDDSGQFGVALRYYADWLNATEFGFYFTNLHSRLPFVQLVPQNDSQVFIDVIQATDSSISRQAMPTGCAVAGDLVNDGFLTTGHFGLYASIIPDPVNAPGVNYETLLGLYAISDPNNPGATLGHDPNGYMAAVAPLADAILFSARTPGFFDDGGTPYDGIDESLLDDDTPLGTITADLANGGSLLTLMQINCALSAAQSGIVAFDPGNFNPAAHGGLTQTAPMLVTGAETLNLSTQHGVRFQYPEDIRTYAISFNTTVGTWGVQGELVYRDNQPLQVDTDSLTIASAALQCAFPAGVGDLGLAFETMNTNGVSCNPTAAAEPIDGYVREEVWTGNIGTTATFTGSNPLIGLLGADLGILVTEAGFVYVPDAPAEGDFSRRQLSNTSCQGSDLPLGGLLGLDFRHGCRPDDLSYGYTLLGRLDYNNVFGAFTVSPQMAFSHNVEGTSPSPISNYVEDRMSLNFGIGASYQNTWRASLNYTNYFGGGIYNKDRDRDFASFSLSYSF